MKRLWILTIPAASYAHGVWWIVATGDAKTFAAIAACVLGFATVPALIFASETP